MILLKIIFFKLIQILTRQNHIVKKLLVELYD